MIPLLFDVFGLPWPCQNYPRGCREILIESELENHEINCVFRLVNCVNNFCTNGAVDEKIVFKDDYRSGSNYSTGVGVNANSENYESMRSKVVDPTQGSTCSFIRQCFIGNIGENQSEKLYVRDIGIARSWVPAGSVNFRQNSNLIIQSGGIAGVHKDTGVVQQGFAGISGATQNCSPLAYGSSIQSVVNKQVLEIHVKHAEQEGVNGYVASSNYAIGDILRQIQYTGSTGVSGITGSFLLHGGSFADPTTSRYAYGEVVSWVNTASGPVIYVEALFKQERQCKQYGRWKQVL